MEKMAKLTATFLIAGFLILCFPNLLEGGHLLAPAVAGTFYPAGPEELATMIKSFTQEGSPDPLRRERITGVLAPHAGYIYLGMTAGLAYREIFGNRYDLFIVLGPSHFVRSEGAAIMLQGTFSTSLCMVEIDSEAPRKIYSHSPSLFTVSSLPFLQMAIGDFTFIPIEVNVLEEDFLFKGADVIYSTVKGKNVFVVSSTDLEKKRTVFSKGGGIR